MQNGSLRPLQKTCLNSIVNSKKCPRVSQSNDPIQKSHSWFQFSRWHTSYNLYAQIIGPIIYSWLKYNYHGQISKQRIKGCEKIFFKGRFLISKFCYFWCQCQTSQLWIAQKFLTLLNYLQLLIEAFLCTCYLRNKYRRVINLKVLAQILSSTKIVNIYLFILTVGFSIDGGWVVFVVIHKSNGRKDFIYFFIKRVMVP